jgi:hypothetical protein
MAPKRSATACTAARTSSVENSGNSFTRAVNPKRFGPDVVDGTSRALHRRLADGDGR